MKRLPGKMRNGISEDQKIKIFLGSMPPTPPRGSRLQRSFHYAPPSCAYLNGVTTLRPCSEIPRTVQSYRWVPFVLTTTLSVLYIKQTNKQTNKTVLISTRDLNPGPPSSQDRCSNCSATKRPVASLTIF